MPGRSYNSDSYKYGFIGAENDNEVSGTGNAQDHMFRSYDTRLGRYKSVDPLTGKFPGFTPYAYAMNQPIWAIDLEGLERYIVTFRSFIPAPKLDNPPPMVYFSDNKSFKGDNRKSYQLNSTAYRTEQKVNIDFPAKSSKVLNNRASGTTAFGADGNVTETSSPGKAGNVSVSDMTADPNGTTVNFSIDASNKLVPGAPAINADFSLRIEPQEDGSFKYNLSGDKDGFPAYELFIEDQDNGKSYLILGTNPDESGDTPLSLFPPSEDDYNLGGSSNSAREGKEFKFSDTPNTKEE